jgi:hypothetical protein
MSAKNKLEDIDIATVEAMRDKLLTLGLTREDLIIERSFELSNKLYPMVHPLYAKKNLVRKDNGELKLELANNLENIVKNMEQIGKKTKNTLEKANDIIFNRAEEKQRQYGPIDESLEDTAIIASIISNEPITTEMVYAVLIGLKSSRLKLNKKHDTFLDLVSYIAAYEDYLNKQKNK